MYSNLDNIFSRMQLSNRREATEREGTSADNHCAPTSGPSSARLRSAANSALVQLKSMSARLTPTQRNSIALMENLRTARDEARSNRDLFVPAAVAHANGEDERKTLARRPSFLLAAPILEDMETVRPDSLEECARGLSVGEKRVLTAQTAILRAQIKTQEQIVLAEARAGTRLCPLTLEHQDFAEFLDAQRPQLLETIRACSLPERQRKRALDSTFSNLATAYLANRGIHLTGISREETVINEQGIRFDDSPVSVQLIPGEGLPKHVILDEDDEVACFLFIRTDGIDATADDPTSLSSSEFGLSKEFAQCNVTERTAAMFLQHLFCELSVMELEMKFMTAPDEVTDDASSPEARTGDDLCYDGTAVFGDECESLNSATQRKETIKSLGLVRLQSKMEADHRKI